jgi:serralysin
MNAVTKSPFQNATLLPLFAEVAEGSDVAGGTSTTAVINVDDEFLGSITSSDSDWVAVTLETGTSYVFSTWGTGGSTTGIGDTVLTLRDSNGAQIAINDDSTQGSNFFSLIEYNITVTGTYYLDVAGFNAGDTGTYTLAVTDNIYTPTQVASFLTEYSWGVPVQLAYELDASRTITYNITNLTADGQQLAQWALESWTQVTGITFTATTASGQLQFDDASNGAFAGPSSFDPTTGAINFSSINIGTTWLDFYDTSLDSYSFLTYMHEIGHALGLGHAGEYNGVATYGDDNHFLNDSYQMTIMSYFNQVENTYINGDYALPVTPMIADIIAIQKLYGTGPTNTSGNTVWGENNTVGGYLGALIAALYDDDPIDPDMFANRENLAITIYDEGGIDTINLSSITTNTTVDLTPGSLNGISGDDGNLLIAEGTLIEDAFTGSGNDTIIGNQTANVLNSGTGNDMLTGNAGADSLFGSLGDDTLMGGTGADFLNGGSNNDSLLGDSSVDRLYGGTGNDTLRGGTGADAIYGQDGNDSLLGNTGVDELYGGAGDDWISPGNGVDIAYGNAGNDTIIGRTGWDSIYGGDDEDFLYGSEGQDYVSGGNGNDYVSGGFGFDTVLGGAGNDSVYGNLGADYLHGGDDNDSLYGATGNDTLIGGNGDDLMYGSQGNDQLEGGAGNDTMFGGSLNDTFIFDMGHGHDIINDFEIGRDIIVLDSNLIGEAATGQDILDMFGNTSSGQIVLTFDSATSITIANHDSYEFLYTNPTTSEETTFNIADFFTI